MTELPRNSCGSTGRPGRCPREQAQKCADFRERKVTAKTAPEKETKKQQPEGQVDPRWARGTFYLLLLKPIRHRAILIPILLIRKLRFRKVT